MQANGDADGSRSGLPSFSITVLLGLPAGQCVIQEIFGGAERKAQKKAPPNPRENFPKIFSKFLEGVWGTLFSKSV
ncbi:MAG: hypothetical protein IJZ02_05100, partial [Clostridia bacterium]|nr:hypothetical protein [Clostridia bacterium]